MPTPKGKAPLHQGKMLLPRTKALKRRNSLPIHCYAAKFGDDLARKLLSRFADSGKTVLDPFSGSGTTVVQAAEMGMRGIGIDVDPVACLISRVQARRYSRKWLGNFRANALAAITHLEESLRLRKKQLAHVEAGSRFCVNGYVAQPPNRPEINFWFSKRQRIILSALTAHMSGMSDSRTRDLFGLAISASIIRKWPNTLSRAMDIDHSRPHRMIPKKDSLSWGFNLFRRVLQQITEQVEVKAIPKIRRIPQIVQGDSIRVMTRLPASSIDCVLTSPPYLNAINYPRAHKFAEWWLYPDSSICQTKNYVGLRRKHSWTTSDQLHAILAKHALYPKKLAKRNPRLARQVVRYFEDILSIIENCHRVLRQEAPAIIVLADNTHKGRRIPVVHVVAEIMRSVGFKRVRVRTRKIRPSRRRYPLAFVGVMRKEAIIFGMK